MPQAQRRTDCRYRRGYIERKRHGCQCRAEKFWELVLVAALDLQSDDVQDDKLGSIRSSLDLLKFALGFRQQIRHAYAHAACRGADYGKPSRIRPASALS